MAATTLLLELVSVVSIVTVMFCATTAAASREFEAQLPAERLIRSLNLFPEKPINYIYNGGLDGAEAGLVERRFSFPGPINGDSGSPTVETLGHHAGYFSLPDTVAARMFYFFFESRSSKRRDDPVVIWLTGGPGCSSSIALFYENGPFKLTNNLSLLWNEYGWDLVSNIIYVDQPIGTGFSYTNDTSDFRHDEAGVSNDLYNFLQAFFQKHPEFVKNDFFITGESYAGHYIPALASRISKGNKAKEGIHINLKGVTIGNGWVHPEIQYPAYMDYALSMKMITQSDYDTIKTQLLPKCQQDEDACAKSGDDCPAAYRSCEQIFDAILRIAGNVNYYDIRKKCEGNVCYNFSGVETFMNEDSVREALGVGDIDFLACSRSVHEMMESDFMQDLDPLIPPLLEDGIRVLIYAGEYDLKCNWLGNSNWLHAMKWSGQKEFAAAATVPFKVDGAEAGLLKSYHTLFFLRVHDSGHLVPMDQPKVALEMLRAWIKGNVALST